MKPYNYNISSGQDDGSSQVLGDSKTVAKINTVIAHDINLFFSQIPKETFPRIYDSIFVLKWSFRIL